MITAQWQGKDDLVQRTVCLRDENFQKLQFNPAGVS